MRVLVVQNFDNTGLGQVGAALQEAGAELDIRNAHHGDPLPETAADHDALVVLGGGQNALDDEAYPYIPPLLLLMRDFGDSGRAVLGICLGSQLLARAYGADNLLGAAPEFGWQEVALTSEAKDDPVLRAAPESFPIFQWHDDTFTLPKGAVRLAGNATAENQAFRIGRAAYGVQFHFEADRSLVRQLERRLRRLSRRASARLGGPPRKRGGAAWPAGRRHRPGARPRLGRRDLNPAPILAPTKVGERCRGLLQPETERGTSIFKSRTSMSAQATRKPAVAFMALRISFVAACLFGAGFRTCRCLDERGWGCGFDSWFEPFRGRWRHREDTGLAYQGADQPLSRRILDRNLFVNLFLPELARART